MVNYMTELRRTVSHSEVESYLSCERKHYYAYGLEINRKASSDALNTGKIGHAILDVFFTARLEGLSIADAQQKAIAWAGAEMAAGPYEKMTLWNTALKAVLFFFESGRLNDYTVVAVEKEYVMNVDDSLDMPFVVDLILRDKAGRLGCVDNKFVGRFYQDRTMELLPQIPKYIGGLRILGEPVFWGAYNLLRTDGAKADTWRERHRFEMMEISDARIQRTFTEQYIASKRIQAKKQLVVEKGEQGMLEWSEDALRVANPMVCDRCSFASLCIAELNNENPQMVLDSEYMKKERREFTDGR